MGCNILKQDNTCLIVDPGDDYNKIKKEIGDCKILGILITHSHFDHIIGLNQIRSLRPDAVVVSTARCSENIGNTHRNLSSTVT